MSLFQVQDIPINMYLQGLIHSSSPYSMFFGNWDQGRQDGVVVVFLYITDEPWAWRGDWKVEERWCLYRQSCETLRCLVGMYVQWSDYQ